MFAVRRWRLEVVWWRGHSRPPAADPRLAYSGFLALEESVGGVREASRGSLF